MPPLDDVLAGKLAIFSENHRLRAPIPCDSADGVAVTRGGKSLVSFAGNDYLGLSAHPSVIEAAKEALARFGAGSRASRLVAGDSALARALEAKLAHTKGTESAFLFGSGYLASIGTVPALVEEGDLILADKLIHACLIDAAHLSGAKLVRFRHNDLRHAGELLAAQRGQYRHCLIMTETVFSMDGDIGSVAELLKLAREHDAWLLTDDAHGLGLDIHAGLHAGGAHIQLGTLSKAAGGYGGYVCASDTVVRYLHNAARSAIFSTALPPASIAAAMTALELMESEPQHARRVLGLARRFTQRLGLPEAQSAIVSVHIGESEAAVAASKALEEHGFFIPAIRPPTVPPGTARLRVSFSARHTEEQVDTLADAIRREGFL